VNVLRRRLLGLAALVVVLAIIVGLPAVLFAVGANPFAGGISWEDLTRPDDGSLALAAIKVVAWIAWAILTLSLLVEIVARLRGIRAPRLPGLALPQGWAQGLVGAVIALFAAAGPAAVAPSPASASPLATVEPALVASDVGPAEIDGAARPLASAAESEASPTVTYTVQPNDSLWSIAEKHLGDGHRYTELVDLNSDLLGGKADFLRPGWVLALPAPPESAAAPVGGPRTVTVQPGDSLSSIAAAELGDPNRFREIFDASTGITQPNGARLSDPDLIQPGWTLVIPGEPAAEETPVVEPVETSSPDQAPASADAPAVERSEEAGTPAAQPVETTPPPPASPDSPDASDGSVPSEDSGQSAGDDLGDEAPWTVLAACGVGTVLAASVVGLVVRRRRAQQRVRKPGQTVPMPVAGPAGLEAELRTTADELVVTTLDTALRGLAQHAHATGESLPPLRAARLSADQVEVYLEEPATLPRPWATTNDGTVWAISRTVVDPATAEAMSDELPAPYPALVTVGHDREDGLILLNLERIGALGVTGDEDDARAVIAAMTLELATATWADDLQVTVVGWFSEVEGIVRSGRVQWVPTVDRLIDRLTERAVGDRAAFAEAEVHDLDAARVARVAPEAWTPEIVVVADFLTDAQQSRLGALVAERPQVAVAAVTSGTSVGEWTLRVGAGAETGVLEPVGMHVVPQRLALDTYDDLLQLVALTDPFEIEGDGVAEATVAEVDAVMGDVVEPEGVTADEPPEAAYVPAAPAPATGLRILVLGPPDVVGESGSVEPSKRARLLELAAYLVLHPHASSGAIDEAIWPDRRTEDNTNTRNTATTKLRRWFGYDDEEREHLPRVAPGAGYAFADTVTSDVGLWDALIGGDPLNASTEHLEAALTLVRGVPFQGTRRNRYAWSEPIRQRLVSEIVDASYTLARRRLMEGRWRAAEAAVIVGLLVDPAQEALWRLRILAAHESRNPAAEAEAIDRLLAITENLEVDLEPETEQLLADLKNPGGPNKTRLRAL